MSSCRNTLNRTSFSLFLPSSYSSALSPVHLSDSGAMAATKSDITSLLHEIQQKGGEFRAGDDRSRQALLASTQALVSLLESPVERVAKMCFHEVYAPGLTIQHDLFDLSVALLGSRRCSQPFGYAWICTSSKRCKRVERDQRT